MSRPYHTSFDQGRSPITSPPSALTPNSGLNFRTNINRNKTKRWVNAPKVDYGGGWGDDDDEDEEDEEERELLREEEEGSSQPKGQPSAPPLQKASTHPASTLHRQHSFDRGDDGLVSPVSATSQPPSWGRVSDPDIVNLPPTPSELEQRERERQPIHARQPVQQVPTIQVPTPRIGQSPAITPTRPQPSSQLPGQNAQRDTPATSPGSRERIPPQLNSGSSARSAAATGNIKEKPLPVPKEVLEPKAKDETTSHTPPSETKDEPKNEPKRNSLPFNSANLDKPTPPLPPPEDTSLETISEKSYSGQSSPEINQQSTKRGNKDAMYSSPNYEDYEGPGFYADSQHEATPSAAPLSQSSNSYFQQVPATNRSPPPSSNAVTSPTSPPRPGSSSSGRIIRPADIYKRHQEEQRRASEESSRPSMDSVVGPSFESPRPPTRERLPPEANQPRLHSQERSDSRYSVGRPDSRSDSRQDQKDVDARPGSRSSSRSITSNPYLPPVQKLPTLPGGPALPEPRFSTWGSDLINVYTASPIDAGKTHESSFNAQGSRTAEIQAAARRPSLGSVRQDSDTLASPASGGIRSMVDGAFHRQDTLLPTPSSDGSKSNDISPIMQHAPGKIDQQVPLPDTPRAVPIRGASDSSGDVTSPQSTESGSAGDKSPDNDELDEFLGELVRANTPGVDSSPHTPVPTNPRASRRQSKQLELPHPEAGNRESTGLFSLYDSYWEEESDPPPPIQPKSPRRSSNTPDPLRRSTQGFPPPQNTQRSPPPIDVTARLAAEEPQTPASTISSTADPELLEMLATSRKYLRRSGSTALSEAQKEDLRAAEIEETPEAKTPTNKPVQDDALTPTMPPEIETVEATPPRALGPESEGMEVITGPTKVPPREGKDGEDKSSSEGNEYARELVNQFSRPQTLLLKDTMPMPSGVMVMPPMPPMPQPHNQSMIAPDAVNFEDDIEEKETEKAERPQSAERDSGKGSGEEGLVQKGEDVSPTATPPPSSETPAHQALYQQQQAERPRGPALRDTKIIATLPTAAERTTAYNALRKHIAETPSDLSNWLAWQMEHNKGKELVEATVVPRKSNATALKKSQSRMGIGRAFQSTSGDGETAEKAAEKLEKMGRGMAKVGERAGGKVGGWMRKVGKKGHASKESGGGGANSGSFYSRFQGPNAGNSPVSTLSLASTVMTERNVPSGDDTQPPLPLPPSTGQHQHQHQHRETATSHPQQSTTRLDAVRKSSVDEPRATPPVVSRQQQQISSPSPPPQTMQSVRQMAQYPKRMDSLPSIDPVTSPEDNETITRPIYPKREDSLKPQLPSQESDSFFARDVMAAMNKDDNGDDLYSRPEKPKKPEKPTPSPLNITPQVPPKDDQIIEITKPASSNRNSESKASESSQLNQHPALNGQDRNRSIDLEVERASQQAAFQHQKPAPNEQLPDPSAQNDVQQQMPRPSRRNSQGLMKSITGLASTKKNDGTKPAFLAPLESSSGRTVALQQEKIEDTGKEKKKRGSFLGRVKAGVDGMARSTSLNAPAFQSSGGRTSPQNGKAGKRPGLLSRLGTDQRRDALGREHSNGSDISEKEKNHKKGFSVDLFSRSASTSGISSKLAKAGLAGGGSGGAKALVSGHKTTGEPNKKQNGPYAAPLSAPPQEHPYAQVQGQPQSSQYGQQPYVSGQHGPPDGYYVPASALQPLPSSPSRSNSVARVGGYGSDDTYASQQPYAGVRNASYSSVPPSRQPTIAENGSPPHGLSQQPSPHFAHQPAPNSQFAQSYYNTNHLKPTRAPSAASSEHHSISYFGPEHQQPTLRIVNEPKDDSISPRSSFQPPPNTDIYVSSQPGSSPLLPPIKRGSSLLSETSQSHHENDPQPERQSASSMVSSPSAGVGSPMSRTETRTSLRGSNIIDQPTAQRLSSPPTVSPPGASPPVASPSITISPLSNETTTMDTGKTETASVHLKEPTTPVTIVDASTATTAKSPQSHPLTADEGVVNGDKGKAKAVADLEEKIAIFHEHEDHEGLQAVEEPKKEEESEDEAIVMSATAFPGQAWEPEFYGY